MDTSQHLESAQITQLQSPSSLPADLSTPSSSLPHPPSPSLGRAVEGRDVPQYCIVAEADHSMNRVDSLEINQIPVIPPHAVVPPRAKIEADNLIATKISTATQAASPPATQNPSPQASSTIHNPSTNVESTLDGAQESTMVFGHKSTPSATQRRRNYASTNAVTDYEADLTNKDRTKQKEAVKRYLGERVKSNWTYEWPRPESDTLVEDPPILNAESLSEQKWKERDEWQSDASASTDNLAIPTTATSPDTPSARDSTFRFETPDGIGDAIKQLQHEKKERRKRRLAEEIAINDGLKCFVARRDAWTGARKVSKPKKGSFALPKPVQQRGSVSSGDGGSSTAIEAEDDEEWETETEIPIAPPLIPAENAMRASVSPAAYNVIYDKVVVQSITPACPLNLKDVVRSCVQGWKRDGQWPPKSMPEPAKRKSRKLSVASLFSWKEQEKETKATAAATTTTTTDIGSGKDGERRSSVAGFRKSFQRIITLGHAGKEGGRAHAPEVTPVP